MYILTNYNLLQEFNNFVYAIFLDGSRARMLNNLLQNTKGLVNEH